MKLFIVVILILGINAATLTTVKSLNVQQYMGKWWEVATSKIVHLTFESNGFCVMATYSLNKNGTIGVLNQMRKGSVTGQVTSIKGYATRSNPIKFPGQLVVNFNNGFPANYYIYQLGPVVNGQYDYSIVTEPNLLYMWVLVRNPSTYQAKYAAKITKTLNNLGFTGFLNGYQAQNLAGCLSY